MELCALRCLMTKCDIYENLRIEINRDCCRYPYLIKEFLKCCMVRVTRVFDSRWNSKYCNLVDEIVELWIALRCIGLGHIITLKARDH